MDKNTKCGNSFSQLDCKEHLVMKLFGFAEMFIFFTPVYVDLLCFFLSCVGYVFVRLCLWSGLKAPAEPSCRVPTYIVYFFKFILGEYFS